MRIKALLTLFLAGSTFAACTSSDDDETAAAPATQTTTQETSTDDDDDTTESAVELTSGTAVFDYGLAALSTASPGVLAINATTLLDEVVQSDELPMCANHGEPWDAEAGVRMSSTHPAFAETTFSCQLGFSGSPDTVRGAFESNRKVLCEMERSVEGGLEYTAAGNVYEDVTILPTADCGWSAEEIAEIAEQSGGAGFQGTITATSYSSGDWQKGLEVTVPDVLGFKLYYTATATTVAIKQIESWSQASRGDDRDESLADDATGTRGGVISLDLATGTLRAEIADTYWGRRARVFAKGTINTTTGAFTSIDELSGSFGNFGYSSSNDGGQLYGEVSTVQGTTADGFRYYTAKYDCGPSNSCDVLSTVRSAATLTAQEPSCSPDGKTCDGNDGIVLGTDEADYDFLMVGASMDSQDGTRADFEAWIVDAGIPTFEAFTKDPTL